MALVVLFDEGESFTDERSLTANQAAAVRASLELEPDTFGLRLIGKDGTVKGTASEPVAMEELYALIDTMPMRRQEQRR